MHAGFAAGRRPLRIVVGHFVVAAAGIAVASLPRAAAAQAPGEQLCGDCQTTGKVAHPHDPDALQREKDAKLCSVFLRADADAFGLDWIPCPKCRTPSVQARAKQEFEQAVGSRKAWLAAREAEVDERLGRKVDHLETKHFTIAWDIPTLKVGRVIYRSHDAMHLYAERMEQLHAQILEILGITDREKSGHRYYLYFFEAEKDSNKIAAYVTTQTSGGGGSTQYGGKESQHCTHRNEKTFRKDEDFHQSIVHTVSHLVFDHVREKQDWLLDRHGWVHEGLGHYMEIRLFGPPNTWCAQEQGNFIHWKGDSWEANVKKAVAAGDVCVFQEVMKKKSGELTSKEHQFAWSWIDYLMWYDPHRMDELLGMLKTRVETRDALQKAYGMSVGQFVEGWQEFVKTVYAARPNKGPTVREPRKVGGASPSPDPSGKSGG